MKEIFNFSSPISLGVYLISVIVSNVLIFLIMLYITIKIKRKLVTIFNCVSYLIFAVATIFMMNTLTYVSCMLIFISNFLFIRNNQGEFKRNMARLFNKATKPLKVQDIDSDENKGSKGLIKKLATAVEWLSRNKVGAIITFEKTVPLDNYIKSGTIINCPFTPELVETIFYEGTRLHDGAIVIRDNIILAAAVYYQPSTKAVIGKFGARHRAALGISEVSDALTIVVSEETGRISITHNGMMDNIKMDEFEKIVSMELL